MLCPSLKAFAFQELASATAEFSPDRCIERNDQGSVYSAWIQADSRLPVDPEAGPIHVAVVRLSAADGLMVSTAINMEAAQRERENHRDPQRTQRDTHTPTEIHKERERERHREYGFGANPDLLTSVDGRVLRNGDQKCNCCRSCKTGICAG
jgi:hypothetical protein